MASSQTQTQGQTQGQGQGQGGCLSDQGILSKIESGDVIISPFCSKQLNTASYDVTLGPHYYVSQQIPVKFNSYKEGDIYHTACNPYDEEHVRSSWIYCQAETAKTALFKKEMKNISPDDRIIILNPGETILGHTMEFIGGRHNIVTEMKARSSLGRNCIAVCKCAGWGDIGYTNRWTMEITNMSQHNRMILVVGRRIAQIVFYETTTPTLRDYSTEGKYQDGECSEEKWKPEDMLPKMWNDYETGDASGFESKRRTPQ